MQFGDYRIEIIPDTEFRLDGGAMFGVVPRVLWEKKCPPDEFNRIKMNMNCLFIETPKERILVETGIGEKWSEKETQIYGIFRKKPFTQTLFEKTGYKPEDISIVVNTHLHFDHAGGNTILKNHPDGKPSPLLKQEGSSFAAQAQESGEMSVPRAVAIGLPKENLPANYTNRREKESVGRNPHVSKGGNDRDQEALTEENLPTKYANEREKKSADRNPNVSKSGNHGNVIPQFPNARYFVSKSELEHAQNPHERDQASYLSENWEPLIRSGQLIAKPDTYQVVEGLTLETIRGHSETMQTVKLKRGGKILYGFADLIPMTAHLKLPWIAGFDLFPLETLEAKKRLLRQAAEGNWICLFYHDWEMPIGRLNEFGGKFESAKVEEK